MSDRERAEELRQDLIMVQLSPDMSVKVFVDVIERRLADARAAGYAEAIEKCVDLTRQKQAVILADVDANCRAMESLVCDVLLLTFKSLQP